MKPNKIYYHFMCGCINTKYNIHHDRKCCPDCKDIFRVEIRSFLCVHCGKYCERSSQGKTNLICRKCSNNGKNKRSRVKAKTKPVVTNKIKGLSYFPGKKMRVPKGADTLTKALDDNIACIPCKNLFEFRRGFGV